MSGRPVVLAWLAAVALAVAGGCARPCAEAVAAPRPATDAVASAAERLRAWAASSPTAPADAEAALRELAALHREGALAPALRRLAEDLLPRTASPAARLGEADRAVEMVAAALCLRGLLPACEGLRLETWSEVSARHADVLARSAVPRDERRVDDPRYVAEMESVSGARFREAGEVRLLIDGPASWAARRELIAGARSSIDMLTWAIYDDATGWELAHDLMRRAAEGVDVLLCVDGRVARQPGHGAVVTWLERQAAARGVPLRVVRWTHPERPFDGQHRKLLVVDGDAVIAGGMNPGDAYSHRAADPAQRWRDTDLLVRGPVAADAARIVRSVAGASPRPGTPLSDMPSRPPGARPVPWVSVADQAPGSGDGALLLLLKAMDAARHTIDVENAYYVRIPSVEHALLAARGRGVRVRLLTNSPESLDEPLLTVGILSSLVPLFDAGVECWLKRGATLHSKFLVVDGVFLSVGSLNLHPRSLRLEGESTVSVLDRDQARALTRAFEADLAAARPVRSASDLEPPHDPLGRLAFLVFRDLL